jgi:hypothetical protein
MVKFTHLSTPDVNAASFFFPGCVQEPVHANIEMTNDLILCLREALFPVARAIRVRRMDAFCIKTVDT